MERSQLVLFILLRRCCTIRLTAYPAIVDRSSIKMNWVQLNKS